MGNETILAKIIRKFLHECTNETCDNYTAKHGQIYVKVFDFHMQILIIIDITLTSAYILKIIEILPNKQSIPI